MLILCELSIQRLNWTDAKVSYGPLKQKEILNQASNINVKNNKSIFSFEANMEPFFNKKKTNPFLVKWI